MLLCKLKLVVADIYIQKTILTPASLHKNLPLNITETREKS